MMLNALLFKFQKNLRFLVNCQQSIEAIASFSDNYKEMIKTKIGASSRNPLFDRQSSTGQPVDIKTMLKALQADYIDSIKDNILNLKLAAVSLAQKLYDLFGRLLLEEAYASDPLIELINPLNLCKIFIQFTQSKELVERVRDLVQSQSHIEEFFKDEGIEDVFDSNCPSTFLFAHE